MSAIVWSCLQILVQLWLLTTACLGAVWVLERLGVLRDTAVREWWWRCAPALALMAALLQAAGQIASGPALREQVGAPVPAPAVHRTAPASAAAAAAKGGTEQHGGKTAMAMPAPPSPRAVDTARGVGVPRLAGEALVAAWLAGSLLLGLRLVGALWQVRRLRRSARPLVYGESFDALRTLCAQHAMPLPQLGVAEALDSPVALLGGHVLLPPWGVELPAAQQRAMLAHELAHLQRRDPAWRLGAALVQALLWPVPLLALARRRLDLLAEFACDARAAALVGGGRPLAECLADCLERRTPRGAPSLALAMAAPRSPLLQRAERLLQGIPMTTQRLSPWLRLAPLGLAIGLALAVPAVVLRAQEAHTRSTSVSVTRDDDDPCQIVFGSCDSSSEHNGRVRVIQQDGSHRLRVDMDGRVRFAEDESEVVDMGEGASLAIEERRDGVTRRVELQRAGSGIARRYQVDGHEVAENAELRQWWALLIPTLLRETGIDAEARVQRLLAKGGAPAVLKEIDLLHSDSVRARYLLLLNDARQLEPAQLHAALQATQGLDSDYELRRVLQALFAKQSPGHEALAELLEQAKRLDSDYERAELLCATAPRAMTEQATRAAWFEALDGIGSDYEKRRSLGAATQKNVDTPTLETLIKASQAIGSDHEKRVALETIATASDQPNAIAHAYADAAGGIDSDFERRAALTALIVRGKLDPAASLAVLDAVAQMSSDFESRQVLVALAQAMPPDAAVLQRYREVASGLSDFERSQAERAMPGVAG